MEGLALILMAADWSQCWLMKVGVVVTISKNKTTMQFALSIQALLLILVSLLFPPRLQLLLPLKTWTPQSHSWGLESTFSNSGWCWYFDLFPHITNVLDGIKKSESFLEGFKFNFSRSIRGISISRSYSLTKMYFLNNKCESQNYSLIHRL